MRRAATATQTVVIAKAEKNAALPPRRNKRLNRSWLMPVDARHQVAAASKRTSGSDVTGASACIFCKNAVEIVYFIYLIF